MRLQMSSLIETRKFLSILSNQSGNVIPVWMVKDAANKAEKGDLSRVDTIIQSLKKNEVHPALSTLIKLVEQEIQNQNIINQSKTRCTQRL